MNKRLSADHLRTICAEAGAVDLPPYRRMDWQAPSVVYFITALRGPIKIGVAVDQKRRLHQVQVSSPAKLTVAASIPGAFEQERYLHQHFARERLHGEWFRRSRRLSSYLLSLMEGE